jgi:LTXXQ motif family protein
VSFASRLNLLQRAAAVAVTAVAVVISVVAAISAVGGHFLGGGHFGETHFGGERVNIDRMGEVGHGFAHRAVGLDRIRTPEVFGRHEFTRNGFGERHEWDRWGGRHWGGGWHRWGGWYGPVFWPFFYGDVFSYALWPDAGFDPFWSYGPDYLLSGIYSPGPYYSGSTASAYDAYDSDASPVVVSPAAASPSNAPAACSGLAPGVTDLPIGPIRDGVEPTAEQDRALDALQSAAWQARAVIEASCDNQVPATPLERLDAVERRIDAMIQAVQIVRTPLATFYDSLSEGQKGRLLALGMPSSNLPSPPAAGRAALCDPHAASFAQLPMDRIERVVQPTAQQEGAFEGLKAASARAVDRLEAACPATAPQTPVERIDAIQTRLRAMAEAAESLRPALTAFYAKLDSDQKTRLESSALLAKGG